MAEASGGSRLRASRGGSSAFAASRGRLGPEIDSLVEPGFSLRADARGNPSVAPAEAQGWVQNRVQGWVQNRVQGSLVETLIKMCTSKSSPVAPFTSSNVQIAALKSLHPLKIESNMRSWIHPWDQRRVCVCVCVWVVMEL